MSIRLTSQELKTAQLTMIKGLASKEAANRMHVSKRTVDFHLANIYDKCGVNSKAEAVRVLVMADILTFPKHGANSASMHDATEAE